MSEFLRREMSDNEKDFNGADGPSFTYRNVPVYQYDGGLTFWFGENCEDYVSSLKNEAEAKLWVDKEYEHKARRDATGFEVFAMGEEGTETVKYCESEEEAKKAVIRLTRLMENDTWVNETSLVRVIGFNYDNGPGNEKRG